jgi:predicted nucleotidyltransferase
VDPFVPLARALNDRAVRYVIIGVAAANYYAHTGAVVFTTKDFDIFLPADPENLLRSWAACESIGLELWVGAEPLDKPRDEWLAERVVSRRMVIRVTGEAELFVDLTLVMAGFDFESVWNERRTFNVEGVSVPVARLQHIVTSKYAAGRDKDRLFLATHREALEELLRREGT